MKQSLGCPGDCWQLAMHGSCFQPQNWGSLSYSYGWKLNIFGTISIFLSVFYILPISPRFFPVYNGCKTLFSYHRPELPAFLLTVEVDLYPALVLRSKIREGWICYPLWSYGDFWGFQPLENWGGLDLLSCSLKGKTWKNNSSIAIF